MARLSFALVLLSVALLSAPAFAAENRKLLQQVNIPVTAQCLNLLDNSQILNIPNLNVGLIQAIASVLGGGGQTPSAIFWNNGSSSNDCTNNQSFNNTQNCGSLVGPIVLPVLGKGFLTPCYSSGGRKLLQQVNAPVTAQCINLLNNNQIGNVPNLNAGIIQLIAGIAGSGQAPTALFFNSGSDSNACQNDQSFNNYENCGSLVGPVVLPILGEGILTPCYGSGGRKLLQQVNAPITVQCLNVLDNNQIANLANADLQVIGLILNLLGAGGAQSPSALFLNSGSANNNCQNNQNFTNNEQCSSVIGPIVLPVLGKAFFTPCYSSNGGRKLLQQINAPITVQCINLLDNNQILNIPNLNLGIIQAIAAVLGGSGQSPTALFFNSGTSTNHCSNNQEFKNYSKCGSLVGPLVIPILGEGTVTPCYN